MTSKSEKDQCDLTATLPGESRDDPLPVGEAAGQHRNALVRFLRKRLRNHDDAEDVAQEAYVRLLSRDRGGSIHYLSTYLFRAALNIATDRVRSERVRRSSDHCSIDDIDMIDEQPSPEREIAAKQDLSRIYEAIRLLPPKCRQVFILSRVRHMTYPEIARHCGISVKMVEKHVSHALAVCLKKVGGRASGSSNNL